MYGLIIKKKWLDLIMSGKKTLEIRGCRTSHVGEEIALLESGSQKIRGFCTIKEVMALEKGKWEAHRDRHCVDVPWGNLIKRYMSFAEKYRVMREKSGKYQKQEEKTDEEKNWDVCSHWMYFLQWIIHRRMPVSGYCERDIVV